MLTVLPSRVMNYRVSASSPTDELITLGQIFSEVGDYASSSFDSEYLSLSRKCTSRLNKVTGELMARQCIQSPDDLYQMPESDPEKTDLAEMTIDELHRLYRRWPIRRQAREAEGRETRTFYFEGLIVRELLRRKASSKREQLKIDYCVATYNDELDNLSSILSLPVTAAIPTQPEAATISAKTAAIPAKAAATVTLAKPEATMPAKPATISTKNDAAASAGKHPDSAGSHSPEELASRIRAHRDFRDIEGRESLIECVDQALAYLQQNPATPSAAPLIAELASLAQTNTIALPARLALASA